MALCLHTQQMKSPTQFITNFFISLSLCDKVLKASLTVMTSTVLFVFPRLFVISVTISFVQFSLKIIKVFHFPKN